MDETRLLLDAARRGAAYRERLHARAAGPSAAAVEALNTHFSGDLPEVGAAASALLGQLDAYAAPATVASAGGRYFGYVVGGSLPVATAAHWMATAWDQNAALVDMSPAAARLDALALKWAGQALSLPPPIAGGLTTGATAANIVALAAARSRLLARAGWDVEADGLFGAPELKVIVGEEVHDSVRKALMVLGLGRDRVIAVPTDDHGRMRAEALPALDALSIVCTQAGHVLTGAIDPVEAVVAQARPAGAWVHVDGAFGLWARASARYAAQTAGIEQADSCSTDAHKWLNVPYDSGLVFTRDPAAMRGAMAAWAPLLSDERQPAAYTLEQSRRARGVDLWAALAHLGRRGVAELVEHSCDRADELAEGCRAAGGDVDPACKLNQLLVRFGDDARTDAVCAALKADGVILGTRVVWRGRVFLALSVSSWATGPEDVNQAIQAVRAAADRCR